MQMKRTKLVVIDHGFGTAKVFSGLFSSVALYHNKRQITKDSVILFEGGTDIGVRFYGEKRGERTQLPHYLRDAYEAEAFYTAMRFGAACIGICRGAQLLTALNNGKIIQDVSNHTKDHLVTVKDGETFLSTSCHHQMMNPFVLPPEKYEIIGWTATPISNYYLDGNDEQSFIPEIEPEIVYFPFTKCLCIQGHPEWALPSSRYRKICNDLAKQLLLL